MNAAYENLLTRRSVRKYKSEQITDEELNAVYDLFMEELFADEDTDEGEDE